MAMEATEYAFPFDAEECEGGYDREYIADDFARYFRAFITSGIIADGGNIAESLQVVANDDMTTILKKGNLIIDGYRYELSEDMIFHHTAADGVLDRIDRISVTLDTAGREIHAIVREGEYSYNPLAPEYRRNSEHLDYVVADVRVVAGAIKIAQANITDTRLSTELCGVAHPFWKLDTQAFFVQLNSFYNEFVAKSDQSYAQFQDWQRDKKEEIEEWKTAETVETDNWQKVKEDNFEEWADGFIRTWEGWMSGKVGDWTNEILDWFNNLREQLTDNAEVRLQEQIGNLNDLQTEEKSSLVAAINTLGNRITSAVTTLKDGISKAVKKSGDTMTGTLNSSKKTQTYLAGNKGDAIINSTAPAGEYTMLDKLNSQNGYFTDGVWGTRREFHYTSKATVDADTNSVEQTLVLMDEDGNAKFPQEVTARMFIGLLAGTAQRAQADRSGRDIEDEYVRNSDLRSKTRLNDTEYIRYDAGTSMKEEYVPLTTRKDHNNFSLKYYLVIGVGSSSNGTTVGNIDFARADILYEQINADGSYIWKRLQIGASGSTARWNLIINKNEEGLTVRVPKGSWAEVLILEI